MFPSLTYMSNLVQKTSKSVKNKKLNLASKISSKSYEQSTVYLRPRGDVPSPKWHADRSHTNGLKLPLQ